MTTENTITESAPLTPEAVAEELVKTSSFTELVATLVQYHNNAESLRLKLESAEREARNQRSRWATLAQTIEEFLIEHIKDEQVSVDDLKELAEELEIELTKEFTSKFIKSKNALPDADNFAVESNGTTTHIIINHANVSTNKIKFTAATKRAVPMSPVCFSAKLFKEILTANSDCTGTLEVSSKGLGRVTLQNTEFKATYYLVKLSIQ
jgi:hypothetical protein